MLVQNKQFYCADCDHRFQQAVGEAIVTAICPGCRKWVSLWKVASFLGLSFGEFLVALGLGYAAYRILRS